MPTYIFDGETPPQQAARWTEFCNSLAWEKGTLDAASYDAFLRAASLAVPVELALQFIEERILEAGDIPRPRKLRSQAVRAYGFAASEEATFEPRKRLRWPEVNRAMLTGILARGKGLPALRDQSPMDVSRENAESIADALFPTKPLLCIGLDQRRFATKERESWRGRLERHALIVPSPMSAVVGITKEGRESMHSLANTGPRRFLVIEFDFGSQDDHASLMLHLAEYAPLVLVVFSGGKSLHGWFYCEGHEEASVRRFMEYAVSLGADPATWVRSQFVRMPGGWRTDTKTRQSIHFFSPEAIQ